MLTDSSKVFFTSFCLFVFDFFFDFDFVFGLACLEGFNIDESEGSSLFSSSSSVYDLKHSLDKFTLGF